MIPATPQANYRDRVSNEHCFAMNIDNAEERKNEVEALKAIYAVSHDCLLLCTASTHARVCAQDDFELESGNDESLSDAAFKIRLVPHPSQGVY